MMTAANQRPNGRSSRILSLRRGVVLAVAVLATVSSLAAWPISPETQITTPSATGEVENVKWNLPNGEPNSLDPIKSYYDSNNTVLANICQGLLTEKPDLTLAPGLAESYANPTPTTWVYRLRPGVKFSNGDPLTAEDVVYSLRRNTDPKLGSYWAIPFYKKVKSIEAMAPNKVKVTLSKPDALFNRMMATAAGAISEKSYVEQAGSKYGSPSGGLMCTGPYALKKWTPGSKIVLTKNPHYWDDSQPIYAKKVTFYFLTNPPTIMSALLTGQLDGSYEVPTTLIARLRSASSGTLFFGIGTQYSEYRYTMKVGPTNNPKIREALSLAINRSAIVKAAYRGAGTPSLTPIQPTQWGYGAGQFKAAQGKIGPPVMDLKKAKQLVKKAGSPKQTIVVAAESDQLASITATEELIKAGRSIGLNMQMKAMTPKMASTIWFDSKVRKQYDMFWATEYGAGVADPVVALSELTPLSAYDYGPGPGKYNNKKATAALEGGLRKPEGAERATLIGRAEVALVKDNALLTIAYHPSTAFVNKRLTGMPVSLAFLYYPWAADIGTAK